MGAVLAGIGFVAVMFAWCHFVPDEETRAQQMIALWILLIVANVVVFVLDRHFHFLSSY